MKHDDLIARLRRLAEHSRKYGQNYSFRAASDAADALERPTTITQERADELTDAIYYGELSGHDPGAQEIVDALLAMLGIRVEDER